MRREVHIGVGLDYFQQARTALFGWQRLAETSRCSGRSVKERVTERYIEAIIAYCAAGHPPVGMINDKVRP